LVLPNAFAFSENTDKLVGCLKYSKVLSELNLSGCQLSLKATRIIGNYIVFYGRTIRELNISHCRITNQGTRYIVDALNRNTSIRFFNFAGNNLASSLYEYSIKLGAIITRHPNMMHMDLTATQIKREEILFIGLSLSMSKTMLSVHLTGNALPYYDRIFLRSLIAAKVGFRFQSETKLSNKIKNNNEYA
jgi:hypothetical protein